MHDLFASSRRSCVCKIISNKTHSHSRRRESAIALPRAPSAVKGMQLAEHLGRARGLLFKTCTTLCE